MPILLDRYKIYNKQLKQLIDAYDKLEKVLDEKPVQVFLQEFRDDKARVDKLKMEITLSHDAIGSDRNKLMDKNGILTETKIAALNLNIDNTYRAIDEKVAELKTLENKISIDADNLILKALSTNKSPANKYMTALNGAIQIREQMDVTVSAIQTLMMGGLLDEDKNKSKEAKATPISAEEKNEAIQWSKTNNASLKSKSLATDAKLIKDFDFNMYQNYHNPKYGQILLERLKDIDQFDDIKNKFSQGKVSINKLADLYSDMTEKQVKYREILPAFVQNILPQDTYLKSLDGKTEKALKNITDFVNKCNFNDPKTDKAALQKMFLSVNVKLDDARIDKLFEQGAQQKQEKQHFQLKR